jgi:hypothetical protein
MPIVLRTWNAGDTLAAADLNQNFSALLAGVTGALPTTGGTMGGPIVLPADPTQPLQAATKRYIDAVVGTGAVLPAIGTSPLYMLRVNSGATAYELRSPAQVLADIGAAGPLTLQADPITALGAATKQYVDARVGIGRNRLHNGWLEVQQRGAGPFTGTGPTNGLTADRWYQAVGSGSTSINGVSSFYGGCRYALGYSGSLTANSTIEFIQRIESVNSFDLAGQDVTVSFYGAALTSAGSFQASIYVTFPTAVNNYASTTGFTSTNVTLTSTPARVSATFAIPAAAANGMAVGFRCTQLTSTGTLIFNASGFQAEAGDLPTPIEKRPYGLELALCQRYYQTGQLLGTWSGVSGQNVSASVMLPVVMRATPTLTVVNNFCSNVTSPGLSGSNIIVYSTGTATTSATTTANIQFSAAADL